MMALQRDLLAANIGHDFLTTGSESLITRARNIQVKDFMSNPRFNKYQRLCFIDADIGFSVEGVGKLWNTDADVVCGAYPRKTPDRPATTIWKDSKEVLRTEIETVTSVDYAGTGFLMIKRNVFETLAQAHPEWEVEDKEGIKYHCFFQALPEDGVELSEDYFFCKRWRELGGEIIVDPTIVLRHWGPHSYTDV